LQLEKGFDDNARLLTPPGSAAIAVVRIDGRRVRAFLDEHFSKPIALSRCVHGELRDGETVVDDPVVILADEGKSAEIQLHGGPWVVAATLDLLRRSGFEVIEQQAGPLDLKVVAGETLLEREVLAYLPLARTEEAVRLLLAQVKNWTMLLSGPLPAGAFGRIGDLTPMLFPPRVAIVGAPNVGKSTLANQLFAQERSITADLPGTTRDWVGEIANLDGLPVMLVDTPGMRKADDPIEHAAIARSGAVVGAADLIVEVRDASDEADAARPPWPEALVVMNKIDRRIRSDGPHDVETVATTGQGIDVLRRAIRANFGFEPLDLTRAMIWTDRHRTLLERARQDLRVLDEIRA
jgi:tRNA modification GTPase